MKTKSLKIYVLVILAQICFYACCGDEFNIYLNTAILTPQDDADDDISSVANENFNLQFSSDYEVDLIASLSNSSNIIAPAYASCDDNYNFMKRVTKIVLTADVPLFGIPAGASLNDHVIVEYAFNQGNQFSMADLLFETNNNSYYFETFLRFDTDIPATTNVNFTITLTFDTDEVLSNTTASIIFE